MIQNSMYPAVESAYPVFNPMFKEFSNERLYEALCAATAPLDAGLEELQRRLKPIIVSAARAFLKALSWTFDNAMGEALICIWDIVRKHSYRAVVGKHGTITGFHTFFARAWSNRLNSLYTKAILKGPVMAGSIQTGWCAHQPVYCSMMAFDPSSTDHSRACFIFGSIHQLKRGVRLSPKPALMACWMRFARIFKSNGETRQPTYRP